MLRLISIAIGLNVLALATSAAQADTMSGEKLFAQCRGCHQVGETANHQFGPTLNGVIDRVAGYADDYQYSSAFKSASAAGLVWNDKTMDEFLAGPMQYIKGTKMSFPGITDESHRATLIAYLKQFNSEGENTAAAIVNSESVVPGVKLERKLASEFDIPEHGVLHLGRAALDVEVSAWDIDIRPDGTGLPKGAGNAVDGGVLYDRHCASCHGVFGEGTGRWPILAGGQESLTEERPDKTIGSYWPYLSTVYDYIRRAMPFGNARSLSDNDVYAVTAYLLYLNDLEGEEFELTSENLASIRLPNEQNFIADNRDDEVFRTLGAAKVCMTDCKATPARVTQRARALDVTPDGE